MINKAKGKQHLCRVLRILRDGEHKTEAGVNDAILAPRQHDPYSRSH